MMFFSRQQVPMIQSNMIGIENTEVSIKQLLTSYQIFIYFILDLHKCFG